MNSYPVRERDTTLINTKVVADSIYKLTEYKHDSNTYKNIDIHADEFKKET